MTVFHAFPTRTIAVLKTLCYAVGADIPPNADLMFDVEVTHANALILHFSTSLADAPRIENRTLEIIFTDGDGVGHPSILIIARKRLSLRHIIMVFFLRVVGEDQWQEGLLHSGGDQGVPVRDSCIACVHTLCTQKWCARLVCNEHRSFHMHSGRLEAWRDSKLKKYDTDSE